MRQTLFHIPVEIGGFDLFGSQGVLLWAWLLLGSGHLARESFRRGFAEAAREYLAYYLIVAAGLAFLVPRIAAPAGIPIRGFGVTLLFAVVAGVLLARRRAKQLNIDPELIYRITLACFLPGILGARIFYVLEYWEQFERLTTAATLGEILNVTQGGLVVYGGVMGGFSGLLIYLIVHRLPVLAMFDVVAPSMALGLALGRLGCFLNGCCFGGVTTAALAVSFPFGSPPHRHQVAHGDVDLHGLMLVDDGTGRAVVDDVLDDSPAAKAGIQPGDRLVAVNEIPVHSDYISDVPLAQRALFDASRPGGPVNVFVEGDASPKVMLLGQQLPGSMPVHPTQLYSAANGLLLCVLLWVFYPFRPRDGTVFAVLITLYPLSRFALELVRTDEPPQFGTSLTIAQWISIVILLGAAALWAYILSGKRTPATWPARFAVPHRATTHASD